METDTINVLNFSHESHMMIIFQLEKVAQMKYQTENT